MENIAPDTDAIDNSSITFRERLNYDKLTFHYISLPIMLISHLFGAVLLSAMLLNVVDIYSIEIWLILIIIMFLYRFYHYNLFRKESETNKLKHAKLWLDRYYTNVLLGGMIWGSSAFLIFPESDLLYQMIHLLFLFTIGFSSLGVLAAKQDLLLVYVLAMFGPLLWRLFFIENTLYTNIAYAVLALMLLMIIVANYYGKVINNALNNRQHFVNIKHSHDKLKERFFTLFDHAPVGIYYYDEGLNLQEINREFMQMNKVDKKENLLGRSLYTLHNEQIIQAHENTFIGETGNYRGPFKMLNASNENIYVDLSTVPMFNGDGEVAGGITIVNDITSEVTAKEEMIKTAYYDMLTNIPNRTLAMDKLKNLIAGKEKMENYSTLLFLDIDNFKRINETFGHTVGDGVLKQTVHTLEEAIGTHDTLSRISGDKFLIMIPLTGDTQEEATEATLAYIANIEHYFKEPFKVANKDYHMSFSIGAVLFSQADATAYDLLKRAETAMYDAKKTSRGSTKFYQDSMSEHSKEELMIENDIHAAIQNDEFIMYYQPQLNIQTNKIVGAEALIRWDHPVKGFIPPSKFIPIAEESGIIVKLEEWIFNKIFSDVKSLSEEKGTFTLNHIAINVSTIHFLEPNFVERLMLLVNKHEVKPEWFELEITESGIMRNINEAIQKIHELKAFGFTFSIDDFGTGYSSLAYLKELPVDVIKVDQSFVLNMNENDEAVIEAVIAIGQKFNLEILAEGVEETSILNRLKDISCNTYQGYLAHRPMEMKNLKMLL
ncbi:MAG TPA: EAL domain-containing protein [Sulfurovum sp.]|nr:EAL domain-containing protein [Sulfurovum sp.]